MDYTWLPTTFVHRTRAFFSMVPFGVLGYPEINYYVPPEYIDKDKLTDRHALSIFAKEQVVF